MVILGLRQEIQETDWVLDEEVNRQVAEIMEATDIEEERPREIPRLVRPGSSRCLLREYDTTATTNVEVPPPPFPLPYPHLRSPRIRPGGFLLHRNPFRHNCFIMNKDIPRPRLPATFPTLLQDPGEA